MANKDTFPEKAVKTAIGDLNDAEARIPGEYPLHPNTVLNTIYNVFPNDNDGIVTAPSIMYFGIGIMGCYNVGDQNQRKAFQPKKEEANLYEPIPFRCVPIDQDLSTAERTMYRMRVERQFNGARYWCYYLKKLEIVDVSSEIIRIDPITGESSPYEFSKEYLTPKPVKGEVSGTMEGALTEVVVTKRVRAALTGAEVYEAINVIKDGDLSYADISEWGIFTGVDKRVNGFDVGGVSMPYTEAIYAQMAYKLCNIGTGVHSANQTMDRIFTFGNGKLVHESL